MSIFAKLILLSIVNLWSCAPEKQTSPNLNLKPNEDPSLTSSQNQDLKDFKKAVKTTETEIKNNRKEFENVLKFLKEHPKFAKQNLAGKYFYKTKEYQSGDNTVLKFSNEEIIVNEDDTITYKGEKYENKDELVKKLAKDYVQTFSKKINNLKNKATTKEKESEFNLQMNKILNASKINDNSNIIKELNKVLEKKNRQFDEIKQSLDNLLGEIKKLKSSTESKLGHTSDPQTRKDITNEYQNEV